MQKSDRSTGNDDRRKYVRCSVYGFMHATATLSDSAEAEGQAEEAKRRSCTGLLSDISHEGAQITMPSDCGKYIKENQRVTVRIRTTFLEKMDVDVAAELIYIVRAEGTSGLQVGVKFTDLGTNPRAQGAIGQICEYGRKLEAVSAAQAEQVASAES